MRGIKLATAVVVSTICALQSCAAFAPRPIVPRVQVEGVRAGSLVDKAVTLVIALKVTNPNAFAVAIDQVEAEVRIEGSPTATGHLPMPVTLVANGDTHVDVEAHTTLDALSRLLEAALRKGRLAYEINGFAVVQDGRRITYEKQGEMRPADLLGPRS